MISIGYKSFISERITILDKKFEHNYIMQKNVDWSLFNGGMTIHVWTVYY